MHKQLLKNLLPPLLPDQFKRPDESSSTSGPKRRRRDYSPLSWKLYFERQKLVKFEGNSFCVYSSGSEGPAVIFLHGGGFSSMSWAVMSNLLSRQVHCQVVAVDTRGHGTTETADDSSLSAESQAHDIERVIECLWEGSPPPIVLVGHSMGGAIAVHAIARKLIPSAVGLVVIDVVEGCAMDALSSMQGVLSGRPKSFVSLEKAIEWSVRAGQTRNVEAARISVPGQLRTVSLERGGEVLPSASMTAPDTIEEEGEGEGEANQIGKPTEESQEVTKEAESYTWRIDLSKTQPHWEGWFKGLSQLFLSCPVAKLLLLAGVDRLDKDLSIGQMQGKFEMHVLPQCGHTIHEDSPQRVSELLANFLVRNKFAASKELI